MSDHQIGLVGLVLTAVSVVVAIVGLATAKSNKKKVIQSQKVTRGSSAIQSGRDTHADNKSDLNS